MKMHRFFVAPQMLLSRIIKIEGGEIPKQISKVLRMQAGEEVMFLDGDGFEYITRLIKISPREIQGEILKRQINANEPSLKIILYQALIKKDNLEWAFQKCTEVGVVTFAPIVCERGEKLGWKADRAKKIITEAAEQSERAIVPELLEPLDFGKALQKAARSGAPTIVLHPQGDPIRNFSRAKQLVALNIFAGPEGGFSDAEIDAARALKAEGHPFEIVSLGQRILRAETAGAVAAAVMLNR